MTSSVHGVGNRASVTGQGSASEAGADDAGSGPATASTPPVATAARAATSRRRRACGGGAGRASGRLRGVLERGLRDLCRNDNAVTFPRSTPSWCHQRTRDAWIAQLGRSSDARGPAPENRVRAL
ncbi:hypothetical protein GCM10007368_38540 [Isoptericola cucumis]|uniref:Uncharacterized protein n=1 Tax=Isoptericola cucumis TaxID=1776856 RepID=A0ABQ2BD75_9MICO|nr:hypothetical protein GCM10007368_38540 [Isoptericola cucumis]